MMLDKKMQEKSIKTWCVEHKKELIIAGLTIVGSVIIVKNRKAIGDLFTGKHVNSLNLQTAPPMITPDSVVKIPDEIDEIVNNLTGRMLTARKLGDIALCSAQDINKRLVSKGFMIKNPNGEYSMTDLGKKFGESTWKTTAYGHSFTNIEWDEKILDVIFSEEELQTIEQFKEQARKILAA